MSLSYYLQEEWRTTRERVIARDKTCVRCGSDEKFEVHHKKALSIGGDNSDDNLETLCQDCHRRTKKQSRFGVKK